MGESAATGLPSAGLRQKLLTLPWWRSFKESVSELFEKYTMHGYKNLNENKRIAFEKFIWVCVHIFAIAISMWIVNSLWTDFTNNPTVTTLESQNYGIENIPFPAVGLCNVNRISKRRALAYAEEL